MVKVWTRRAFHRGSRLQAALLAFLLVGCARLDIQAIGLHDRIVNGDQPQIDAGNVVRVNRVPGIWLAGHRTEGAAVFANLVFLHVGDEVCAYSTCWHVIEKRVVPDTYWPPPGGLAPLVLQTSWPGNRLLLVLCA